MRESMLSTPPHWTTHLQRAGPPAGSARSWTLLFCRLTDLFSHCSLYNWSMFCRNALQLLLVLPGSDHVANQGDWAAFGSSWFLVSLTEYCDTPIILPVLWYIYCYLLLTFAFDPTADSLLPAPTPTCEIDTGSLLRESTVTCNPNPDYMPLDMWFGLLDFSSTKKCA